VATQKWAPMSHDSLSDEGALNGLGHLGKVRKLGFQQEHYQATWLFGGVVLELQDGEVTLA